MNINKFKFAQLISWFSNAYSIIMTEENIKCIWHHIETMDCTPTVPIEQPRVNCANVDDLLKSMFNGSKIEAIKQYRAITGTGLRESKDAVEKYWTHKGHPND